jgi:hypothetical protein
MTIRTDCTKKLILERTKKLCDDIIAARRSNFSQMERFERVCDLSDDGNSTGSLILDDGYGKNTCYESAPK